MEEGAVPRKPISAHLAHLIRIRVDLTQTIQANKSAPQASQVIVLTQLMAINQELTNLRRQKITTRVFLGDSFLLQSTNRNSHLNTTIIPTLAQIIGNHLLVRNCKYPPSLKWLNQ